MFDSTKKFNSECSEFENLACRFGSNKIVVYKSQHTRRISQCQEEQAKINFERKTYNGYMSRQTKSYITKLLDNWFMTVRHFNKYQAIPAKLQQKKLVFFTLTLPSKQRHDDNFIKREILNKFIVSARYHGYVDDFFWRAEKQKNGNIHFHFLADRYFDKKILQNLWNRCLVKDGYIDEFEKKYKHRNPPTTQIQEIPANQNIIDYVIKYVGKNEGVEVVKGRIWGCSDKLRELQAFKADLDTKNEKIINTFVNEDSKNVYQDENCMVIMVQFEERLKYYKMLENQGLNTTMSANSNYLYFGGQTPTIQLYGEKKPKPKIETKKTKLTQFQLFENEFYKTQLF